MTKMQCNDIKQQQEIDDSIQENVMFLKRKEERGLNEGENQADIPQMP